MPMDRSGISRPPWISPGQGIEFPHRRSRALQTGGCLRHGDPQDLLVNFRELNKTDWWFGTMEFYDFPYVGNNHHPN